MKVTRYIFAAALTVIAAVSCQKEDTPDQAKGCPVIFSASFKQAPESNVSMGDSYIATDGKTHHRVLWDNDDRISMFDNANNNSRFITYCTNGSASADFQFSSGTFNESESYISLYPYRSSTAIDQENKVISFTYNSVSNVQSPTVNTFPTADMALMLGRSKGPAYENEKGKTIVDLTFEHLFAFVKFEIVGEDIAGIRFMGKNNEILAQKSKGFEINYSSETPLIQSINGTQAQIFIYGDGVKSDATQKIAPGTYYLTVFPANLTSGIRFGIWTDTYESFAQELKPSTPVDLKPGMILDLGKFNSSGRVKE